MENLWLSKTEDVFEYFSHCSNSSRSNILVLTYITKKTPFEENLRPFLRVLICPLIKNRTEILSQAELLSQQCPESGHHRLSFDLRNVR